MDKLVKERLEENLKFWQKKQLEAETHVDWIKERIKAINEHLGA